MPYTHAAKAQRARWVGVAGGSSGQAERGLCRAGRCRCLGLVLSGEGEHLAEVKRTMSFLQEKCGSITVFSVNSCESLQSFQIKTNKILKGGKNSCLSFVPHNEHGLDFALNPSLRKISGDGCGTADRTARLRCTDSTAGSPTERCSLTPCTKRSLKQSILKHSGEWGQCCRRGRSGSVPLWTYSYHWTLDVPFYRVSLAVDITYNKQNKLYCITC